MACLVYSDNSGHQIVHDLGRDAVRIGRATDNDVVSMDLRVSRHHAVVSRDAEGYRIQDVGSSLGVHLNNRKVDDARLRDGDTIRLGDSLYVFVDHPPARTDALEGPHPAGAVVFGSALVSGVREAARALRSVVEGSTKGARPSSDVSREDALERMEVSLEALRADVSRIERARQTMRTLYEIGRVLNSAVDRENLLDLIMELGLKFLRAERGFLMLSEGPSGRLALKVARNMGEDVPSGGDVGISAGIARQVAASGEAVLTSDALSDRRFQDHQSVVDFRIRSVVCVPLRDRAGAVMGVIYVDNRSAGQPFDEESRDFLAAFANYASIAIENQRLVSEAAARARMEEELRAVRRLDEMKSQLMSMVAHDVRTPLTSIRSYAEILSDDFEEMPPDKRRTFLGFIVREAERLNRLTSDYLDIEKIESGAMELQVDEIDPADLVKETCEAFQGSASKAGVTIRGEPTEGATRFRGDQDRLLQVMANLVSNAIKFTGKGGSVRVAARGLSSEEGPPSILFEVVDTGTGIAPEDIERLFRKFAQVGAARPGRARGTGLGLALAREIVELHGGRIGVESTPGAGSRFFFTVPMSPVVSGSSGV